MKEKDMKEENQKIVEELPFLRFKTWDPNSRRYVPKEGANGTKLDCLPSGWREIALEMFRKIKDKLMETGGQEAVDNFEIDQLKEKFGEIRLYAHPVSDEVEEIIDEYEQKSADICCNCGKPATRWSKGWVCPYCDKCYPEWWVGVKDPGDEDRFVRIDRSSEEALENSAAEALGYRLK